MTVSGGSAGVSGTDGYDRTGQLVSSSPPSVSFGYDQDRRVVTNAGIAQAFDATGELCWTASVAAAGSGRVCGSPPAFGASPFVYDAAGQRRTGGGDTFSWDANAHLSSATTTSGTTGYAYAADGLRTSSSTSGVTKSTTWDDTAEVPAVLDHAGTDYLWGPGGLAVKAITSTTVTDLHTDGLGTVRLGTDAGGAVSFTQDLDAWGNPTGHTGTPPAIGYKSQLTDPETGLIYLRARYYDPVTAQFLTPDPLYALTGERYGYAGNDPINSDDPLGLSTCGKPKSIWDVVGSAVDCAAQGGHHMVDTLVSASWAQANGPSPAPSPVPKVVRDNPGMQVLGGDAGTLGCANTLAQVGISGAPVGTSSFIGQMPRLSGGNAEPGVWDCLKLFMPKASASTARPEVQFCGPIPPRTTPYVWELKLGTVQDG